MKEVLTGAGAIILAAVVLCYLGLNDDGTTRQPTTTSSTDSGDNEDRNSATPEKAISPAGSKTNDLGGYAAQNISANAKPLFSTTRQSERDGSKSVYSVFDDHIAKATERDGYRSEDKVHIKDITSVEARSSEGQGSVLLFIKGSKISRTTWVGGTSNETLRENSTLLIPIKTRKDYADVKGVLTTALKREGKRITFDETKLTAASPRTSRLSKPPPKSTESSPQHNTGSSKTHLRNQTQAAQPRLYSRR